MSSATGKNIYFASDFHLGVPDRETSFEREKRIIRWINSVEKDMLELHLVGDVFDFWFEYKHAIPKGSVRLQAKLADLTDKGVPVHYYTGNHDMWVFDYLPTELGLILHRGPVRRTYAGKQFFIGHGDGLGPGDHGYKFIKAVFANPLCQWAFAWLHPNFGLWLANFWSGTSRNATAEEVWLGDNKEFLMQFCKEELAKNKTDYFIFGHRHLVVDKELAGGCRYINLGDWLRFNTYAVFDGSVLRLEAFKG